ncbi:hypothetical protein BDV96DRAFT_571885 [Lophiotrema nucula]|uniref:Actin-like ATPase domain-containing protein n=1 Tax=Lophiotrema nucula TaxID=690887 RepID=A0A6A5ZDK4_9PLEO|nr:hypothetical protein BDV96DRAFT_571885 [Lophiotrema nucula]
MNKAPSSAPKLGSLATSTPGTHGGMPGPSTTSTPSSTTPAGILPHRVAVDSAYRIESDDFSEVDYVPTDIGRTRLVIAIDYGTTYTGIGWATPETDVADTKLVNVLQKWGGNMGNTVKIPSVISYTPCIAAHIEQFGSDLSDDAITMVNTKLELDPQETRMEELDLILQVLDGMKDLKFEYIKESHGYPSYTWKGPEEIITDYLSKVFKKFEMATEQINEIKVAVPVDIIITVPVGWSYGAKNSTFKAVVEAGFNERNFPHLSNYYLVAEPEAAAIYTAQFLKQEEAENLKKGECFVLCDAGGGTVDVVGYKVKGTDPSLELEAITIATGAKCGSSFINRKFRTWLRKILGDRNYNFLDPRSESQRVSGHTMEGPKMREVMQRFEALKKGFNKFSNDMHMDLPEPLHTLTYGGKVEMGELTITRDDMSQFFHDCIDNVIELVQGQINQVEGKRHRVKSVFLIGGFSESEYLQQELQHSFGMRKLRLRRPEMSWSAVVRGGVLFGMEQGARQNQMTVIPSPKSYGFSCSRAFSKKMHTIKDVYTDPVTGQVNARGQFHWFVQKGDMLHAEEERVIEQEFFWHFQEHHNRHIRLPIYEYADDDIPTRLEITYDELTTVTELTADLSRISLKTFEDFHNPLTGKGFVQVCMVCKVTIKGFALKAELWLGEELMSGSEVQILDNVVLLDF